MKTSTLIWDGKKSKNKKKKDNKNIKKISVDATKKSFFDSFRRKANILFGKRDNLNSNNTSDIESGVELNGKKKNRNGEEGEDEDGIKEDDDEDGNGDEDSFPLLLGDTEESHLMSVFRAQVNASEARINILESELKILREANRRNINDIQSNNNSHDKDDIHLIVDVNNRNKLNPNYQYVNHLNEKKIFSDNNTSNADIELQSNLNVNLSDSAATVNLTECDSNSNISQSTVTDASDEKWHGTYNPLSSSAESKNGSEITKKDEEGRGKGGAADRLLTLSRISLQAKEGKYILCTMADVTIIM